MSNEGESIMTLLTRSVLYVFDKKITAVFRAVVKKRKAFEYKLRRKVKEKVDFLNYIQVCLISLQSALCDLFTFVNISSVDTMSCYSIVTVYFIMECRII